jgi:hypothetical protein
MLHRYKGQQHRPCVGQGDGSRSKWLPGFGLAGMEIWEWCNHPGWGRGGLQNHTYSLEYSTLLQIIILTTKERKCQSIYAYIMINFIWLHVSTRNESSSDHSHLLLSPKSPSWEVNRFAASQEIPSILWNPHSQVPAPCHYPESAQFSPYPTSHFINIHPNIILPSTSGSHQWSLSLWFFHQNPVHASLVPHTRYMLRPSYSSRFYHPQNLGEQYRSWSSSLWSFLHFPVASFLLGPTILLRY